MREREREYSRMDEVKFVEDSLLKNLKGYGLLNPLQPSVAYLYPLENIRKPKVS